MTESVLTDDSSAETTTAPIHVSYVNDVISTNIVSMPTLLLCVSGTTNRRFGQTFSRASLKMHEWPPDMTEPAKCEWMLVEEYLKPFRNLSAIKKALSRLLLR